MPTIKSILESFDEKIGIIRTSDPHEEPVIYNEETIGETIHIKDAIYTGDSEIRNVIKSFLHEQLALLLNEMPGEKKKMWLRKRWNLYITYG